MTTQYDYYQYQKKDRNAELNNNIAEDYNNAMNQEAIQKGEAAKLFKASKAYEDNKLKNYVEATSFSSEPLVLNTTEMQEQRDYEDSLMEIPETLVSDVVLENGKFRFNNIVLPISPEQISVMVDEYEDSLLLMRQDTPVASQSGRKRIRIIVNFAYDFSDNWSDLSKMVIQIRKTPIATIENEKIRKELFGEIEDRSNIGVVVDNLSGYVEDDYPTLLRCTLQMTWFNHAPYVEEIKYVDEVNGRIKWSNLPTKLFEEFYSSGTGGARLINDPTEMDKKDRSLVIMYKEYREFKDTVTKSKMGKGSFLASNITGGDNDTVKKIQDLQSIGWYLATEKPEDAKKVIDGMFYRWRKLEIPYNDLYTSGSLILQNMSFSVNTNPTYIGMESYSMPTIQFLGGSSTSIRAIVFAAAEYNSHDDRTPTESSKELSTLFEVFKKVADDRMRFPKYAKENHLLISHPIAKLMKYRAYGDSTSKYSYFDENKNKNVFDINNFLPVILSSSNSSTIPGLPFASKVQLDFKETRMAANPANISYLGTSGSGQIRNQQESKRKIVEAVFANCAISFSNGKFEKGDKRKSKDSEKAELLVKSLNALRAFDKSVNSLDDAFRSKVFLTNGEDGTGYQEPKTLGIISKKDAFTEQWMDQFVISLYADHANAILAGDSWPGRYIKLFEDFAKVTPSDIRNTYPDIMLPENRLHPAYYFANNENRTNLIRNNILRNMPKNYNKYSAELSDLIIGENIKKFKGPDGKPLIDIENVQYPKDYIVPSYNKGALPEYSDKGTARVNDPNNARTRQINTELAIAHATAPNDSLAKVYPAFQVFLYSDRYDLGQKYSANDLTISDINRKEQMDLLDMYDLSSILDIRIIKDEHEAADVMIIRILQTQKNLMTTQGKDPTYNAETYSIFEEGGLLNSIYSGSSVINQTKTKNLEDIGLKEGTKIKAFLGNSKDQTQLGLEFTGRIAAINGKNVVEIYCIGDGHELIQDTKGYERDEVKIDSDTVDLIGDVLSKAEEVKSFGNTRFELLRGVGLDLPDFMGGVSALDNITAPSMWPGFTDKFIAESAWTGIGAFATIGSISVIIPALAVFPPTLLGLAALAGASAVVGGALTLFSRIANAYNPCQFTIYQQTIWDILQELTLRHPGYICSIVPFDNRSTIFFGEPDSMYFHRGIQSAMERAIKTAGSAAGNRNTTIREIYDKNVKTLVEKNIPESSHPFLLPNAKMQTDIRDALNGLGTKNINTLALLDMQKPFRSYHLVTSEHDIISNDIEANSVDVANSVQVYHPINNDNGNPDGKEWFSDYELTDKMKADDDLLSNYVNNKIFTFHNAHDDDDELELPERYAKAILCKELANIYKGKLTILGRKGIKPHDIVIISDTYNKISGPCGVKRVVHLVSPQNGWTTHIYPKFIAIPDTSAGAFQMKAILKASRYWLGTSTELFYSNMEKFRPSEIADYDKFSDELFRAIETFNDGEQFDDQLSKDDLENDPQGFFDELKAGAASTSDSTVTGAGNVAFNKALGGTDKIIENNSRSIKEGVRKTDMLSRNARKAFEAKKYKKAVQTATVGGAKTLAKVGGKLFTRTAFGFAGGFIIGNILEGVAEGFVNYMKYRQPISIFPLTKDGRPWTAALNGFTENTAIEHIKLQTVKGADKLGYMVSLAKSMYEDWAGEVPADTGYGGDYEVVGIAEDGDTLTIKNGSKTETIRISGIDSGEIKSEGNTKAGGPNEFAMGLEAKKRLNQLIKENGNMITLKRHAPDTYNRTIGEVSINEKTKERVMVGSRDLSEILKEEGLVLGYPSGAPKNLYYQKFSGGAEEVWGRMLEEYKRRYPERANSLRK